MFCLQSLTCKPFATVEMRRGWAQLTFGKNSGTVTRNRGRNMEKKCFPQWFLGSLIETRWLAIRHLHISHNAPYFPPNFAWSLFFISPGYYSRPKRNWKRFLCKILGAKKVHYGRCASGVANKRVSINDPKNHCGKHFFSMLRADAKKAGRGECLLSQASDRSTGLISCVTFMF